MTARIYVEGGGDGPVLRTRCRQAFSRLFEKAGLRGNMPRVVACGSRDQAFSDFCSALRGAGRDDFACLLIDSEDPVSEHTSPWTFLFARDHWRPPETATDRHVHLMVQCMESWLLTDTAAVERFFGQGFRRNAIPNRTDVESISKQDVLTALEHATRGCVAKGAYRKGRHSFAVLATIDARLLEEAAPHARRLFTTLREMGEGG